jgi:NTP pyrophosphatase (non-canonical NTP hydrolase)
MNKQQFEAITKWQNETFPKATAFSKAAHLEQEVQEVREATETGDTSIRLEIADCLILIAGVADKSGMSYEDVCAAIDEKMEINKKRRWGKPDSNGVVNHIKDNE